MDKIDQLNERLNELQFQNTELSNEIDEVRVEILKLRVAARKNQTHSQPDVNPDKTANSEVIEPVTDQLTDSTVESTEQDPVEATTDYFEKRQKSKAALSTEASLGQSSADTFEVPAPPKRIDFEKLIGENLISKIGILIIIAGVAIGTKYSIDKDLINPLTRICLGYLAGIVLLGIGMKLKDKYTDYSAVLVSGAMVIFYFVTFFAFSFYGLISQAVAFGLMVLFTIFTVLASLSYDRQVIAHIGLVGAIAVPFLLSDGSDNVLFMYSYLLLIGIGVFVISLKKEWKKLFYSVFFLTWTIFGGWVLISLDNDKSHIAIGLVFLLAFFLLFYAIFITYKLLNLEKYKIADVVILLINSAVFYGLGYYILDSIVDGGSQYLGLFTVANAAIHFGVARLMHKRKLTDSNLFYLITGLVLVFLTISIPVQLDGNWVTMMWACEAALLFWIGRTKNITFYEYLSYGLMAIAVISLQEDWTRGYDHAYGVVSTKNLTPLLNPIFLTSLISIIAFGFINWVALKKTQIEEIKVHPEILKFATYALPVVFVGLIFGAFSNEITSYFNGKYYASFIDKATGSARSGDFSIHNFRNVWLNNYAMAFLIGLILVARKWLKNELVRQILLGLGALIMIGFLAVSLYELSDLRKAYINRETSEYFSRGPYYIWIRYISLAIFGALTWTISREVSKYYEIKWLRKGIEISLAIVALWLTSSELIHWLDLAGFSNAYGMWLSILWGAFAALVISYGIWKNKKHLRLLGIAIFAFTLVKLFLYDLASLSAISKTIVLVLLGILLLGISFLYTKYTVDEEVA